MDAANLDVPPASFDIAISRMGLMLFPDPQGALRCMWKALKTGGRIGAMVFSLPKFV
jgi:ubiquinone/menaquinone biosynthesis C-methylase UbiE